MTLKEALIVLIEDNDIEHYIYNVRENVDLMELPCGVSSWEHPRVKRFAEACRRLRQELERLEAEG